MADPLKLPEIALPGSVAASNQQEQSIEQQPPRIPRQKYPARHLKQVAISVRETVTKYQMVVTSITSIVTVLTAVWFGLVQTDATWKSLIAVAMVFPVMLIVAVLWSLAATPFKLRKQDRQKALAKKIEKEWEDGHRILRQFTEVSYPSLSSIWWWEVIGETVIKETLGERGLQIFQDVGIEIYPHRVRAQEYANRLHTQLKRIESMMRELRETKLLSP